MKVVTCRQVCFLLLGGSQKKTLGVIVMASVISLALICLLYAGNYLGTGMNLNILPWRAEPQERRLPQCIIVGVRKCGTRALLEFLSQHPDVQHGHNEMHFFDRDEKYALGLEWYRQQMPLSRWGQITIEKTPGYFISHQAPSLIRHMNSSIKLLLIVRDPITRTISDYTQTYTNHLKKNMSYPLFEDLVLDPHTGNINNYYKPTWISLYHLHLVNWIKVFNRSQILIIDGDQLITDPVSALREVEAFLGLKPFLTRNNFYFNKTRGFYCINHGTESQCLNPSKGRVHPMVRTSVIHKLSQFFKPHNDKFFKLAGQTFNWTKEKTIHWNNSHQKLY